MIPDAPRYNILMYTKSRSGSGRRVRLRALSGRALAPAGVRSRLVAHRFRVRNRWGCRASRPATRTCGAKRTRPFPGLPPRFHHPCPSAVGLARCCRVLQQWGSRASAPAPGTCGGKRQRSLQCVSPGYGANPCESRRIRRPQKKEAPSRPLPGGFLSDSERFAAPRCGRNRRKTVVKPADGAPTRTSGLPPTRRTPGPHPREVLFRCRAGLAMQSRCEGTTGALHTNCGWRSATWRRASHVLRNAARSLAAASASSAVTRTNRTRSPGRSCASRSRSARMTCATFG